METIAAFLPDSVKNLPCYMDFDGQRKAEKIFQSIIILFAVVGFVWGYFCQYFSFTVYILGAGFVLACILTLPPWPMYRKKPLKWQPAQRFAENESDNTIPTTDSAVPAQNKQKKKK